MHFNTVSAILRSPWLIERSFVDTHLPLIFGIITGKASGSELFNGNAGMELPFAYANGKKTPAYRYAWSDAAGQYVQIFNEDYFEDNSIFVIPSIGPVLKYNGDCGEPGMVKRQSWASDFKDSKKLTGLISWIDSPGGQADGTPQYTDFIKAIDKPKIALVDGGAYSAGAWIASGHDKIYATNTFSGFGSVGAYTTIVDYAGAFKKLGYKVTDVYPDESSEKNLDWRKAMEGDFSMIKASVAELAKYFISSFAENRTGKLKNDSWTKGRTFNATDAVSLGLIDGIETFEAVAGSMGATTKLPAKQIISLPSNQNSNNMKFTNLAALSGVANPTQEQIDQANADLTGAAITHVTLVRDSFITDAASVTTTNSRLTTELAAANQLVVTANAATETAKGELATANAGLTTANNKITELEAKVEAFGKNAGGLHAGTKETNDLNPDAEADVDKILAAMPHNQAADNLRGF